MRSLLRELLDLVLPPACAACGAAPRPGRALCTRCDGDLPRLGPGLCRRCQERPAPDGLCSVCAGRRTPLYACVAAASLEDAVQRAVHRFKYPEPGLRGLDPAPLALLAELMGEAAARVPGGPPDLVVPVPLHRARLVQRGFNPAERLARAAARAVGAPCDPVALRRLHDTPSQTGLDRPARARNVRDAFAARRALPPRVWLVDDVVTTGATLEAAVRALRAGGASWVAALCAARTPVAATGGITPAAAAPPTTPR